LVAPRLVSLFFLAMTSRKTRAESVLYSDSRGSAWVSGCIATWALASSFIVHLHTNGESRQPPKPIHSQLCNVLGIAAPIVYLAILLPLGIIAGQHYAASQRTATQIKRFLNAAASQWSPGTSYSIATLAPGFPLLALLEDQVGELIKWWKAVFMFYAVSAIVLLAPISSISYLYLTSLRRTINLTAQELGQSIGRNRASQRQIKHTWIVRLSHTILYCSSFKISSILTDRDLDDKQSLVVIMSAFTILASIFFIVSIYAYVRPTSLRRDSTFQGLIFSPLYAFALGGTPCAAVLVFRAIETRSTEKKRSTEGEKEGSNCWSAVWSGSKSSGNTAVDARERGEMQGRDSEAISFGAMLRGFGGGTGGGVGTRRGRGDDELTRSVGAGSSVVVRVEVEVREDGGGSSGEEMKKEREKTFDRI